MNSVHAAELNYGRVSDEPDGPDAHDLLLRRNISKAVADLTSKSPQAILLRKPIDPALQRSSDGHLAFQLPRVELARGLSLNESADVTPAARSSSFAPKGSAAGSDATDSKLEAKKSNSKSTTDWPARPKPGDARPARQRFSTPDKPLTRVSLNQRLTANKEPPASRQKVFGTIFDKNLYTIAEDNTLKPSAAAGRRDEGRPDSSAFLLPKKTDSQPVLPSSRAMLARDQSISDSNRSLSRDRRAFDSRQTDKRENLQRQSKDPKLGPKQGAASKDRQGLKKNPTASSMPMSTQTDPAAKSASKSRTLKHALKKQQELKEQIMRNLPDKQPPAEQNLRVQSSYFAHRNAATLESEPPKESASLRRPNLHAVQPDFQIKSVKLVLPRSPTPKLQPRDSHASGLARGKQKDALTESSQLLPDKYYVGLKKPDRDAAAAPSKESTRSTIMRPGSAQVLLAKRQKPEAQPEPGVRLEGGRKYSAQHALLNLLHGVYMRTKPAAPGQSAAPVKHNVSEGNNGRFVEGLLRQKPGTAHENSHAKANVQWSQSYHSKIVATALKFVPRLSLKELLGKEEFEGLDVLDAEAAARAVVDSRIFRAPSTRGLRDVFFGAARAGQVCFMLAEALNVCNHLKGISCIAHKTKLTLTILRYAKLRKLDPGAVMPKTFLLKITNFERDFERFVAEKKRDDGFKAPVIVKPGENSNRGNGIAMAYSADEAAAAALQILRDRKNTSCAILQYYITHPLLYQRRKFDVRCYGLVVKFSSRVFFYWYLDGYARTSSFEFSLANKHNLMVHLTNEAVQVKGTAGSRRPVQLREPGAGQQSLLRRPARLLRGLAALPREKGQLERRHRARVQGTRSSRRTKRCSPSRPRRRKSRATRPSSASSCSASTS